MLPDPTSRALAGYERRFWAENINCPFSIHLPWHLWDNNVEFRIRIRIRMA